MNGRTAPARSFAWRLWRQCTKIITPTERENMEKERAREDIIRIMKDKKMYVNEKMLQMKVVMNMYKLDYYKENESIFTNPE